MVSIKNMPAGARWIPILILIFTAVFRLLMLADKPPHFDEGVNGFFLDQMQHDGFYKYDPANYHGPLHFYILFLFKAIFGRSVWTVRLPVVIFSVLTVWLAMKFDRFLDRRACWLAALAMAVSPGMEFYGRYGIHESELVFFLILTVWGLAGLWRFGSVAYLWAVASGMTGMILTKETYIIHFTAFLLAALCLIVWERFFPAEPRIEKPVHLDFYTLQFTAIVLAVAGYFVVGKGAEFLLNHFDPAESSSPGFNAQAGILLGMVAAPFCYLAGVKLLARAPFPFVPQRWSPADFGCIAGVCAMALLFFYSGNFSNPILTEVTPVEAGPFHLWLPEVFVNTFITPFAEWTKTGQSGNGHEKEAGYWLMLVMRYEWPAMLGMACSLFYLLPGWNRLVRYLVIYGWGAFTAYSIVRYKTPWCIITIIWPFYFVFGHFFVKLFTERAGGIAMCAALVTVAASFTAALRLNFLPMPGQPFQVTARHHYTDDHEAYVYVQTYEDIGKLMDPLLRLAREDGQNYGMKGHIILTSYHPLPWLLGDFRQVGYYQDNLPDAGSMDADFLLVNVAQVPEVEKSLTQNYFKEHFQLRSSMEEAQLYLNAKKFEHLFPGRKPEFVQGKAAKELPPKTDEEEEEEEP